MARIDELKQEAADLGITFNQNIGEAKLAEKIEAFYAAQEGTVVKEVETVESVVVDAPAKVKTTGKRTMRERIEEAKAEAMKTRIVTITDNDQRENNLTTVVSVNCTNMYFDLGTKRIPLNVPVEVQVGFLNVLKEIKIPMHVADPGRTGLSRRTVRQRYSIAYEDDLKQ